MRTYSKNLVSWVTGRTLGLELPDRGAATVVLEDRDALEWLVEERIAGPGSIVYIPGSEAPSIPGLTAVPYQGSLVEPGAEARLGEDSYLQIQAYSVVSFLMFLGPTVVRITDAEDFEAFISDADAALQQGVWSETLTIPGVHLADISALGGHTPDDGAGLRLYVGQDGEIRVSPLGSAVGSAGETWTDPEGGSPSYDRLPVSLGAEAGIPARPWLGRYHSALQAVQSLRARGHTDLRVSGFGFRFDDESPANGEGADMHQALAPILLESGDDCFLYNPKDARTFKAPLHAARTLERALVQQHSDTAEDSTARELLSRLAPDVWRTS
ncbi:daptide biosynthesis RiPP recognition protein [Streptomyces sp. NPDC056534]|uniref:daptide biosynthesis RiPP recognition protein n=1 Tax=Streptomyces sp. NPDC056534 TaxID=3345857 RepID=UPI0036BDE94A